MFFKKINKMDEKLTTEKLVCLNCNSLVILFEPIFKVTKT